MAVSKERKAELVKEFGKDVKNTGSTEVQIAILTDEINNLTEHLKENKIVEKNVWIISENVSIFT